MIQKFEFTETTLNGVLLIKPFVACDERGYFLKDYSEEVFLANGISHELKEVFYTSSQKGVVRAIHFQRVKTQAKLVRCVKGKIFDVAVDLRKGSETYGKWAGFFLSEDNKYELYIPGEFGHGYLVLEPSIVSYKCSEKFYSEYDDGIKWDDADIGIDWPTDGIDNVILSEKDKNLQSFRQFTQKYGGL